ncbi:hypothetical protein K469DRAFT_716334 [Zopfia rhizophila CBS 207.26]|uniref:Uncharacterized protein n=1 Tax=Zopfia rhizophila CBS 207.26 TaxID=1314779 RepID=A0A6A6DK70_9PEZI|nr:hypothetical protein K469DRAFT_716334 [Zopfia rhizophila CBS 207.26]
MRIPIVVGSAKAFGVSIILSAACLGTRSGGRKEHFTPTVESSTAASFSSLIGPRSQRLFVADHLMSPKL